MIPANECIVTLFPLWSADECRLLADGLQVVKRSGGEVLFSRGDLAEALYFLVEGRLGVRKETGFEDKTQVIALLDPYAPVGERSILCGDEEGITHGATVIAVENCSLYRMEYDDYLHFMDKSPKCAVQLISWLLSCLSMRLEKASERMAHIL